jgi:hypothetical protein
MKDQEWKRFQKQAAIDPMVIDLVIILIVPSNL